MITGTPTRVMMNKSQQELANQYIDKYGADAFSKALKPIKKKRRKWSGPWPQCIGWCEKDKAIQLVFKKYKPLLPLLNELYCHTALHKYKNSSVGVESVEVYGEEKEFVLLYISKHIAEFSERINCSEQTIKRYLKGLCDCDILKIFPRGGAGTFYSMAYWGRFKSKSTGEWGDRRDFWLTEATSDRLKRFRPGK